MVGHLSVTVRNESNQNDNRIVKNSSDDKKESNQEDDSENSEKMRTLWVGGVSDQCEEEVLYELFQNAGPIERISHPVDKTTKKKKAFAFIVYEHEETIRYAYSILNGTELYGQRLRLQHKETGLGIHVAPPNRGRGGGRGMTGARSFSASQLPRSGGGEEHPADRMFASGHGRSFHQGPPMMQMHYGMNQSHGGPGQDMRQFLNMKDQQNFHHGSNRGWNQHNQGGGGGGSWSQDQSYWPGQPQHQDRNGGGAGRDHDHRSSRDQEDMWNRDHDRGGRSRDRDRRDDYDRDRDRYNDRRQHQGSRNDYRDRSDGGRSERRR